MGPLTLKRRYVYCAYCDRGASPSQKLIGLPEGDFTAHLEDVVTMVATSVPYDLATKLVLKSCGIAVSVRAVEQMVERRASVLCALDEAQATRLDPLDATGLPVAVQARPENEVPEKETPKVAYLEIDGVFPMTRTLIPEENLSAKDKRKLQRAKANKVPGGKARRYEVAGREVKNAVLYNAKECVKTSATRGCVLKKTYVSYLGNWKVFALLVWVALLRLRFDKARQLVILSDGAEWMRSFAAWLPIPTVMILDLFHVKHRIWEVANSLYGPHSPKGREWANIQCERIEEGHATKVIAALRFLKSKRAETRELISALGPYLHDNRDRIDYPKFRSKGLRVTTSNVESANFHVTGARLKLQGMRWSEQGAKHMAALRADLFNGIWEQRTQQLLAA